MLRNYCTGLQHVGIPTCRFSETLRFYQALGFARGFETILDRKKVCFLSLAGVTVEIYEQDQTAGHPGAIDHIALQVSDIQACYAEAVASGCNILTEGVRFLPYFENGVHYFTIGGINGEQIEFASPLPLNMA